MKKIFGFLAPRRSSTNSHDNNGSRTPETEDSFPLDAEYVVREKHLRKLHRAAYMGNAQQVQQLLLDRPYYANVRDKKNRTALHLACAKGHLRVVTVLVNEGCHLNLCDLENRTPLMKAIQCQKQECAALLLKYGANPHIQDTAGNTALHYAVFSENTVMAEKLLEYKADIEAKNKSGFTPLLLAVKENKQQMVEFLINKNANVKAVDNMKRTALMLAAKNESSDTIRLLLEHGVDVFSRDQLERTAEDYAHSKGCENNVQLISHYQEERRLKESSETSNLGSPEIHPHLEPIVEVEDPGPPVTAKEEDVETSVPELDNVTTSGDKQETLDEKTAEPTPQQQENAKTSALRIEKEDEDFPGHSEPSVEVEDPDPHVPVEKKVVETSILELLGKMSSEEESVGLDMRENTHPRFVSEQRDSQRTLPVLQNAGRSQGAILTNDLRKPQTTNIGLQKLDSEEKTAEPNLRKRKYVKTSAVRSEKEDVDSPWDSEPSVEVEDPDPHVPVEKKVVETSILELLGKMSSEEDPVGLDMRENTHPRFVSEQCDSQRTLPVLQNAGRSQGAILTNDLRKPQKTNIGLQKLDSEILPLSHLGERNIRQRQHPKDDIGYTHQSDAYHRNLKSLEERISQLEGQNKLVQQQLDADNESDLKVINIQEQLEDIRRILLIPPEKQSHILKDRNTKLMSEFNQFKEETKVVVRQLQQEVDTLKKQAMSQKLEVPSPYYVTLQAEIQDLKKTLQEHRNLIADLADKKKTVSPERAHQEEKNESHQEKLRSMRETVNKCEELQNEKDTWKQRFLNLKSYMITNMIEKCEVEKYKQEIEKEARQYIVETLKKVNLFLQQHSESQDAKEQLREKYITSTKRLTERRVKNLESEVSKVKSSQDSTQKQLENYQQLYQQEFKKRTSLQNQLNEMEESLAETRAQLARERQRAARSTAPARPVLEPPRAGSLGSPSPLRRDPAPRDVRIPTSAPQRRASGESVDAFVARGIGLPNHASLVKRDSKAPLHQRTDAGVPNHHRTPGKSP